MYQTHRGKNVWALFWCILRIFEGNLENAFETTLTVEEPTIDRTITLPNASGTMALIGDTLAYSIVFGS